MRKPMTSTRGMRTENESSNAFQSDVNGKETKFAMKSLQTNLKIYMCLYSFFLGKMWTSNFSFGFYKKLCEMLYVLMAQN